MQSSSESRRWIWALAVAIPLHAADPASACEACPSEIELSRASASCLAARLDDLLDKAKRSDPMLVNLTNCGEDEMAFLALHGDRGHAGTTVVDIEGGIVDKDPPAEPPVFYFLSRHQLVCVGQQLENSKQATSFPMRLDFADCETG